MNGQPPRAGFPAWTAPGIGLVMGTFLAYTTLLQTVPLSPLAPLTTLGLGAGIGFVAGTLISLSERLRR